MTSEPESAALVHQGDVVDAIAVSRPTLMVLTVDDMVAEVDKRQQFMNKVLAAIPGALYKIPGAKPEDPPALGKPGAEALMAAWCLHPEIYETHPAVIDFSGGGQPDGEPLVLIRNGCRVWHQTGARFEDRELIADARGNCNSRETKYRYRMADRVCPECEQPAIKRSRYPPRDDPAAEPGWYCFDKAGGCKANFVFTDPRIADQATGRVKNTEVGDLLNTIEKIASKRAMVAAAIAATGFSALVTQDLEELDGAEPWAPSNGGTPGNGHVPPNGSVTKEQRDQITAICKADTSLRVPNFASLTAAQADQFIKAKGKSSQPTESQPQTSSGEPINAQTGEIGDVDSMRKALRTVKGDDKKRFGEWINKNFPAGGEDRFRSVGELKPEQVKALYDAVFGKPAETAGAI